MVIIGEKFSSIIYNVFREGKAIKNNIKAGIIVQNISTS
jgi:hypothetical protein